MGTPQNLDELETAFCEWARSHTHVEALIVVGSRARLDHPADEWSDLDLGVVTSDAARLGRDSSWIAEIAEPWVVHHDPEGSTWHVVFAGGLDAGIAPIPTVALRAAQLAVGLRRRVPALGRLLPRSAHRRIGALESELRAYCGPGLRILVDKRGAVARTTRDLFSGGAVTVGPLTVADFREIVDGFWFLAVWTVKHLRRGELWHSESVGLTGMRRELLRMVEGNARIEDIPGVWREGRFVEEWVAPSGRDELASAFARYEPADLQRAVLAMFASFDRVAGRVAGVLGTSYPTAKDTAVDEWCRATLHDAGR